MNWLIWGFGGLLAVVATIIAAAAWIAFRRERQAPNRGRKPGQRPGALPKSHPTRGVPKSR